MVKFSTFTTNFGIKKIPFYLNRPQALVMSLYLLTSGCLLSHRTLYSHQLTGSQITERSLYRNFCCGEGWGREQTFINKWMPTVTQNPIQSPVDQQPHYEEVPVLLVLMWGGVGGGGRYAHRCHTEPYTVTSWPTTWLQRGPYIVSFAVGGGGRYLLTSGFLLSHRILYGQQLTNNQITERFLYH